LLPATWKRLKGVLTTWRFKLFSPEIRNMLAAIALSIIGVGAMQVNGFIDTLFARAADLAGPAYLAYAMRLEQFPLALFGIAISSALFPSLSKAIGNGEEKVSQNLLEFGILRTSFLMIPCTIGIFLLGAPAINLLFGHGQFTDLSTIKTTICLWAYGLGLLPTALALLFSQAFFARHDFKTPMILSCCAILINIGFNSLMIFGLHFGATSVALSTSFAAFVNAGVLYFLYRKRYNFPKTRWPAILRIFASTLAGAIACLFVSSWVGDQSIVTILRGELPVFEHGLLKQALTLGLPSLAFLLAFVLTGYLIRCQEMLSLLRRLPSN
jgi:putative peptidoglycan lipid II flippase